MACVSTRSAGKLNCLTISLSFRKGFLLNLRQLLAFQPNTPAQAMNSKGKKALPSENGFYRYRLLRLPEHRESPTGQTTFRDIDRD